MFKKCWDRAKNRIGKKTTVWNTSQVSRLFIGVSHCPVCIVKCRGFLLANNGYSEIPQAGINSLKHISSQDVGCKNGHFPAACMTTRLE